MKRYLDINVYEAATGRFDYIYTHFDKVYVSFSNGKDSGVLLNLAIEAARRHGRLPVNALYVDFEAQYAHAIEFTHRMFSRPEVQGWWVCLPIHLRNAVSQISPYWLCWDKSKRDAWVREYPANKWVVTDEGYFPFFRHGMEFEEFVPAFAEWFSGGRSTACCVGIRSDESINRFRTIACDTKVRLDGLQWTTKLRPHDTTSRVYNCYPIYDWRCEDIWRANGKFGWDYNRIYDIMYMAGVSIYKQRLCQPYGDDQRQGLYLFKLLEPETWAKVVNRVEGANYGNHYTERDKTALGNKRVVLPPGYTYKSYAYFLLDTMPPSVAANFNEKIVRYFETFAEHGTEIAGAVEKAVWRRICKALLKNEYSCRSLTYGATIKEVERKRSVAARLMREL